MKNKKMIINNINKYFNTRIKELKKGASFCDYKTGVRIDTPTDRQTLYEIKRQEKRRAELLARVENAEKAPDIKEVTVRVSWVRSRTWGANPHAEVSIIYTDGYADRLSGTASGCGYDKLSASITDAIENNPAILKLLINNLGKLKKQGLFSHSCYVFSCEGLPILVTAGSGLSSLRRVFEACGLKKYTNECGKMWDFINFSK